MKTISITTGAVLLFATASSLAYAKGTSSVACPDQQMMASTAGTSANPPQKTESESVGDHGPSWQAQKAGDGGSESVGDRGPSFQAQKAGDGGSESVGDRGPSYQAQKTESESVGDHGPSWQAQKAGFAVPCKK